MKNETALILIAVAVVGVFLYVGMQKKTQPVIIQAGQTVPGAAGNEAGDDWVQGLINLAQAAKNIFDDEEE